jgi:hypothetical protein
MHAVGNEIELVPMTFSFPQGRPGGTPVFNFRSEGRHFANSNRCLIPASAFFEFTGKKYPKAKHRFALKGYLITAIAGISREGRGNQPPSFPMLTTAPGSDVAPSRRAEPVRAAVESRRSRADPNGTSRRAAPSPGFACGAEARDAGRASRAEASSRRAEPVHAAAESRRSSAGPNRTAEASRAAASGSPGIACGATARNAGPAFCSQQYPVDVRSWGWAVGHQRLVTRCRASPA